ncbi:hypothetical protein POTOM_060999 [Populus tomentosa]|uniref:Uncharacterized protein n=1 Tax=Populus tomentosa TaxID=118781 RepID=A0A8X8BYN0_POPTO|nr:hypothetical protein POTOM_060999 [Populus tomentosa]
MHKGDSRPLSAPSANYPHGYTMLSPLLQAVKIHVWSMGSNYVVYDFDTGADKNKKESVVNLVGSCSVAFIAAYSSLLFGFVGLTWTSVGAGSIPATLFLACAVICAHVYQNLHHYRLLELFPATVRSFPSSSQQPSNSELFFFSSDSDSSSIPTIPPQQCTCDPPGTLPAVASRRISYALARQQLLHQQHRGPLQALHSTVNKLQLQRSSLSYLIDRDLYCSLVAANNSASATENFSSVTAATNGRLLSIVP